MRHAILVKFQQRHYAEALYRDGHIYMNPLRYFRGQECKYEDERHDLNEGIETHMQMKGATLRMQDPVTGEYKDIAWLTRGTGRVCNSGLDSITVYCLFYFEVPEEGSVRFGEVVPERVWRGFGDTALVIYNPTVFCARVKKAATAAGFEHSQGQVEYVDLSKYHGEMGPFRKDNRFSYQRELRIAVYKLSGNTEPAAVSLYIGNLSDIALLIPAHQVPLLVIEPAESG